MLGVRVLRKPQVICPCSAAPESVGGHRAVPKVKYVPAYSLILMTDEVTLWALS